MLNAVEISSQEAAWFLLQLGMSYSSRKVQIIPTTWPHERYRVRKTKAQMDLENLNAEATDIWKESCIEKYQKRPMNMEQINLATFVAYYTEKKGGNGEYNKRRQPKIIRFNNYPMTELSDYKREMVLLFWPFRNEEIDVLDCNKYLQIYDDNEQVLLAAKKHFQSDIDIEKTMEYCKSLMAEIDDNDADEIDKDAKDKYQQYVQSKDIKDDFVQAIKDSNIDLTDKMLDKMSYLIRKRENVMTSADYCAAMRLTNKEQRELLLEAIFRMQYNN